MPWASNENTTQFLMGGSIGPYQATKQVTLTFEPDRRIKVFDRTKKPADKVMRYHDYQGSGITGLTAAVTEGKVTVVSVSGEVEFMPGGDVGRSRALKAGDAIDTQDRIYTGMGASTTLKFS